MNFDIILDFLKNHYREIIYLAFLIISVVICLIRKRPCVNQIDAIKEYILEMLPVLINGVEKPGEGESKKEAVITVLHKLLIKKYHLTDFTSINQFIIDSLENILSTPQKKGNLYMAKREKKYRRIKAAKRMSRTNLRNLLITKNGRNGAMV